MMPRLFELGQVMLPLLGQFGHRDSFPFGGLVVLACVVLVLVIKRRGGTSRRPMIGEKLCRTCGESHPIWANFCRRCGRRL